MTTIDMILQSSSGSPVIPLENAASLWGCSVDSLVKKIERGEVRLPWFRLDDSQKSRRIVHVHDLAALIDQRRAGAAEDFEKLWS